MKCNMIPSLFLALLILKMKLHETDPELARRTCASAGSSSSAPRSSVARLPFSQVEVQAVWCWQASFPIWETLCLFDGYLLCVCVFILSMSAADLVFFFFFLLLLLQPPSLLLWLGTLYGSFFVFADVVWFCSEMKCLCCQGASPSGWDQVTDGMKMLCFYHPQAEELRSGVAHQFGISMGGMLRRICKARGIHHSPVVSSCFSRFVFVLSRD